MEFTYLTVLCLLRSIWHNLHLQPLLCQYSHLTSLTLIVITRSLCHICCCRMSLACHCHWLVKYDLPIGRLFVFLTVSFPQGSLFDPYLSLQQLDSVRKCQAHGFIVGASNDLLRRQTDWVDAVVEVGMSCFLQLFWCRCGGADQLPCSRLVYLNILQICTWTWTCMHGWAEGRSELKTNGCAWFLENAES